MMTSRNLFQGAEKIMGVRFESKLNCMDVGMSTYGRNFDMNDLQLFRSNSLPKILRWRGEYVEDICEDNLCKFDLV